MNYEFANPGPVNADIRIASGSVDVNAGDHEKIIVTVEPLDDSSASREAAEQTRVHLEGKHLVVHTPHGKGWTVLKWPKLRITAYIPQESLLNVKSASADMTCTGVFHDIVAHTASGDLTVDRVTKDASVTSASGDIKIGWVGGDLRMNSASGDISAQYVGKDTDAHSASGDITIGRADGSARAKTASGDIKIGVASRGEVRAHSASGDVTVGVAAGTAVWLDLNTLSGKTRSELSISDGAPPSGTNLEIKVRTASGDITLHRVVPAE